MSQPDPAKLAELKARRVAYGERKRAYTERWKNENPDKVLKQRRRWAADNVEKRKEQWSTFYEQNRERLRIKGVARRMGIPLEILQAFMLEHDKGRCEICGDEFGENPKVIRHIDHCHQEGNLRGVLCHFCNTALGSAKDSIPRLEALIAYLRKHGK